jgi:Ankyrin repeat
MFFKKKPAASPLDRLVEEKLYERVLDEIESGVRRGGLWLKAVYESDGDESRAKLRYIALRVQAEIDEMKFAAAEESASRARIDERLNGYNVDGRTPLMCAVLDADVRAVEELLEAGADPHLKDGTFGTSTASDLAIRALRVATTEERKAALREIFDLLGRSVGRA